MKRKLSLTIMSALLAITLIGCSGSGNTSNGNETSSSEEKIEYIADTDIANMFSDPESYKGKYVNFSGKIFNGPDTAEDYVA